MTEPFIGEIQLFGFNFNPNGWAYCNGALMPISQNTALFSLLGTTYGGDGKTTYRLPNFAGRAACQEGQGPGLSQRTLGEAFGATAVALLPTQIPSHNHAVLAYSQLDPAKRSGAPVANGGLAFPGSSTAKAYNATPNTQLSPKMVAASTGGDQPHENQQPYLAVNFCIALQGVFPQRP